MLKCHHRVFCLYVFAGVAYLASGWCGILLATQPSNASPIWPAAGVALALMLVFGQKVIPGIFLGALICQSFAFMDLSSSSTLLESFAVGGMAGIGAFLQAGLGMLLINRWVGVRNELVEDRKIVSFFGCIALSCLVSASIGVWSLLLRKVIGPANIVDAWLTWWVGDTIGAAVFTPLTLLFIGQPKVVWQAQI